MSYTTHLHPYSISSSKISELIADISARTEHAVYNTVVVRLATGEWDFVSQNDCTMGHRYYGVLWTIFNKSGCKVAEFIEWE